MKRSPTIDTRGKVHLWVLAAFLATPLTAVALSLNPATDVVPRIFSPNGDGINDAVFFKVNNPQQSFVSGVVLDSSGAQVASLSPAPGGIPTADSLYWNGRDTSGDVVPPGPYIYRIEGDGLPISGVVVVVR